VELLPPLVFKRRLEKPQSIYSFSALSKKQSISFEYSDEESMEIDFNNYFQFPKGSKSGTMQHEILENLAFNSEMPEIETEVEKQLHSNHYDSQWADCLSQQIHTILNTQLWQNGPQLSQLKNSIDEMEFMLSVGFIGNNTISQWLTQHRNKPTEFNQDDLSGFLTGFIDLIFESEGKFYVVDYKSNYLGLEYSDYTHDLLQDAIEHHYYDLQYLLYCVALIKYLKINVNGFDYKKHFGGVAYVFTRGINGEPGQGVYCNIPEQNLLEDMLGAFDGT
jgi:exodeoxyribonuclease V beta subunit